MNSENNISLFLTQFVNLIDILTSYRDICLNTTALKEYYSCQAVMLKQLFSLK